MSFSGDVSPALSSLCSLQASHYRATLSLPVCLLQSLLEWGRYVLDPDIPMLGEFAISLVLSHHSKNLKCWTDKCYSSVLFDKQRKIPPRGLRVG